MGLAGESIFCSDPKAELFHYTADFLKKLGYEVLVLDFKNPEKSMRYNLLQPIIDAISEGDTDRAEMLAWDLTNNLVGKPEGEKIWTNGECSIIAAAILCVVCDNQKRPEFQNMTNVYWFISEMCRTIGNKMPLLEYVKKLSPSHPARALLSISDVAPSRTRGSFYTSALTTLRLFTSKSIYAITHTSDFSFVIMGVAGIGKSTVVKHIMLSEYMKGTKILCIDPESEYKDMCRNLNGSWLNAGGGKNGRSNLLQIRPAPRDDDDETDKLYTDEGNGMSDMALHMKTLEIEFSLYLPSLTDMQKAILKQTIIELYNQFGIFWETDIRQLKATDFPILSDLHALLEKKAEANKENPVYRDLAMLLYDAAAGSDSFLWNGHTTLEANSRFICLDTHDLQNASDNVKRTQYLNLLSWCWEEMSRDRNERCLLVCDEAYLMIDPQVPQSLVFLRNVEKRARKYEAGLAIISHSVVDFLAPEVKMYGQALLDIPCYKILMGCDGKNLQETKDLYNLTDAEQELLESKRRGHALFIIGSKRLHVNFEIPAYKFSYMGKAGGR